jgi:putative transferase (TIGR04331 family)
MLLVTNNFHELIESNERILFLGRWCEPLNQYIEKNNYQFLEYHWLDRIKFRKDFNYLDQISRKLLSELGDQLNKYHKIDLDPKFWDILLNPWLQMFVSSVWDKWESIRIALNTFEIKKVKILKFSNFVPPADFNNYLDYFNTQDWNHFVLAEIIKYQKNDKLICNEILVNRELHFFKLKNNKNFIKFFFDIFFSLFTNNYKVIFIESNFSKKNFLKISLSLRQLPRFFYEFYKNLDLLVLKKIQRETINIDFDFNNEFEKFISKFIINQIPQSYVENFKAIYEYVEKINLKTNLIISANSNFPNEISRMWCANMFAKNKNNFILSEHGGSLPLKYRYYNYFDGIFNKKITWSKPTNNNEFQLTPSKLIDFKKIQSSNKFLSIICLETTQFAYYCQPIQSSIILEDFNQKKIFIDLIKLFIDDFKIKPYTNLGWNLSCKYKEIYGKDKIIEKKSSLEVLKLSKIVVCTYPETSFLEAMVSGVPTILLFKEDFWDINNNFTTLLDLLKKNQIVFNCPIEASSHVKKIWSNPNIWWDSQSVVDVRRLFLSQCGNVSNNWVNEWKNFIYSNS